MTKLRQKDNQRSGTGLSRTRSPFSLLIVVANNNFASNNIIFLRSHLAYTLNYSMMDLGKRINLSKWPNYVDTDNTFHNTNFTTLNAAFSSYQAILPCATHSEVCSCVWMGNSSKSTFLRLLLISKISNFGAAMIIQVFQLSLLNCQESCFSCSFCKIFTLYISRSTVGKLNVIQTSTVPHNAVQISRTPNYLFCGFVTFLEDEMSIPELSYQKNSQVLNSGYICKPNN